MSSVFVVDTNKKPLNPVHPGEARYLLNAGKAAVLKRYPFIIILKYPVDTQEVEPLRVKIDPGSRTTGIAVCNDATGKVVFAAELTHRGQAIRDALLSRRGVRRGRRARHTRYRKPRVQNRTRPQGWLDAACVGKSTPLVLDTRGIVPLRIKATGHPNRQMCSMDRYGFPRTGPKQAACVKGFCTGDMVRAVVTSGVKVGTYVGKVAVRATGSFNIHDEGSNGAGDQPSLLYGCASPRWL